MDEAMADYVVDQFQRQGVAAWKLGDMVYVRTPCALSDPIAVPKGVSIIGWPDGD